MSIKSKLHALFKAFSLIELLIVIAIVAILSALASPYYADYIVRSKLANGLVILENLKEQATEYYSINGAFPTLANLNKVNTDYATNLIDFADMGPNGWTGGDNTSPFVEIQYNSDVVPGQTAPRLAFIGTLNSSNSVEWACYTYAVTNVDNSIDTKFLPQNCAVHQ